MTIDTEPWTVDTVLADGGTVHVRPIRADDGDRLRDFHGRQSRESVYFRFFSPRPKLSEAEVAHLVNVDGTDRVAFVAVLDDGFVGVARYDRVGEHDAPEVAFFTDDAHRGRGIATLLLEYLAARAREVGFAQFTASVLPENRRMARVFRAAGFAVESRFDEGILEFILGIESSPGIDEAVQARAIASEQQAVARLLAPQTIAVIGAGRSETNVGYRVLRNLLAAPFGGVVHPVNTEAHAVAGVRAYRSVGDIQDRVDLAVVCVPAVSVPGVIEECAAAGVRAAAIISAGFAEIGPEGAALQAEIVRVARRSGLRILGPNSLGVINTDPAVRLHATFAEIEPLAGSVGMLSQSGTLGAVVLERAKQLRLGVSSFVAVGNKADLSGNDFLQHWADDDRTQVVLLYLESFGNPRRFSRTVQRVARVKPVFAVRSGASTHVADGDDSATWLDDDTVDALLRQNGVVRVPTLSALLDAARVAATQAIPRGDRVGLVGNSAGSSAMAADACLGAGMRLADLSAVDRPGVPRAHGRSLGNPLDLRHDASADQYEEIVGAVMASGAVDVVLVCHAPYDNSLLTDFYAAIDRVHAAHPDVALVASVFANHPSLTEGGVPLFDFPDAAAHALGAHARHGSWRRRVGSGRVESVADSEALRVAIDGIAGADLTIVADATARAVLEAAGVDLPSRSGLHGGLDIDVRLHVHPVVGHIVEVGPGGGVGSFTNTVVRTVPLSDLDIDDLVDPLHLEEIAGDGSVTALRSLIAGCSAVADSAPDVVEITLRGLHAVADQLGLDEVILRVSPVQVPAHPDIRHL